MRVFYRCSVWFDPPEPLWGRQCTTFYPYSHTLPSFYLILPPILPQFYIITPILPTISLPFHSHTIFYPILPLFYGVLSVSKWLWRCTHVCIHMHITICISTCICICRLQYASQHVYACYNMHIHVTIIMHINMHVNMHIHVTIIMHINMHVNMHMHVTICMSCISWWQRLSLEYGIMSDTRHRMFLFFPTVDCSALATEIAKLQNHNQIIRYEYHYINLHSSQACTLSLIIIATFFP